MSTWPMSKGNTDDIRALAGSREHEWLQRAVALKEDHKKLQREVVKLSLGGMTPKAVASHLGIEQMDVSAILKAFNTFCAKKAF
jgi:DNA-binding CsgD family transcriptional regulator